MQEHIISTRVYYEDTDALGIVYHAKYLCFFERGRTEFFNALGFDLSELNAKGVMIVILNANLHYKKPAKLNQKIEIVTQVAKIGRTSVEYKQFVRAKSDPSIIFCEGDIKVVCVNDNMKPISIPAYIKECLV